MSQAFMYAVAVMYLAAMISFANDGKPAWAIVALSWSVGNFLLGWLSRA